MSERLRTGCRRHRERQRPIHRPILLWLPLSTAGVDNLCRGARRVVVEGWWFEWRRRAGRSTASGVSDSGRPRQQPTGFCTPGVWRKGLSVNGLWWSARHGPRPTAGTTTRMRFSSLQERGDIQKTGAACWLSQTPGGNTPGDFANAEGDELWITSSGTFTPQSAGSLGSASWIARRFGWVRAGSDRPGRAGQIGHRRESGSAGCRGGVRHRGSPGGSTHGPVPRHGGLCGGRPRGGWSGRGRGLGRVCAG